MVFMPFEPGYQQTEPSQDVGLVPLLPAIDFRSEPLDQRRRST